MTHLGRWLSALIDGELDGVERDRVLNHLAGCLACRLEANELRTIKRRMVAFGETSADPSVAGRLIDLARSGAAGPGGSPRPGRPRRAATGPVPAWWACPARNGWLLAGTSTCAAVAAIGATAFLLGGLQAAAPSPKVTPAVYTYWLQHSYDTGQVPATTPAGGSVSPLTPSASRDGGVSAPAHRARSSSPALLPAASTPATVTATPTPRPSRRP